MEHYNATGVTKSGEIKIEVPTQYLLIGVDDIASIADERISIKVQSPADNNVDIAVQVRLIDVFALAQHGEEMGFLNSGMTYFIVPLSTEGAVALVDDDKLVVELDSLAVGITYSINSIASDVATYDLVSYKTKQVESTNLHKEVFMEDADVMCLNGFDHITKASVAFIGGEVRDFEPIELYALERLENDIAFQDADSLEPNLRATQLVLNVDEISSIKFYKTANQVDFTFIEY